MIQKESENALPNTNKFLKDEDYYGIVQDMRDLYKGKITDQEAHEAARNLIGFCKTLLASAAKQGQY